MPAAIEAGVDGTGFLIAAAAPAAAGAGAVRAVPVARAFAAAAGVIAGAVETVAPTTFRIMPSGFVRM